MNVTIELDAGEYPISGLFLPANVTLVGAGSGNTILRLSEFEWRDVPVEGE